MKRGEKMKDKKEERSYVDRFSPLLAMVLGGVIFFILVAFLIRSFINCEGDMFSYSGAVIGGGMTLFGVIITIMYQEIKLDEDREEKEKQHKEDLAIQYRPFLLPIKPIQIKGAELDYSPTSNPIKNEYGEVIEVDNQEVYEKVIYLKLKNNGRGEAIIKNISIDSLFSSTDNILLHYSQQPKDPIFPEQHFNLGLHIEVFDYNCIVSCDSYYDYIVTIEYTDFLGQNTYKQEIKLFFGNSFYDEETKQEDVTDFIISIQ